MLRLRGEECWACSTLRIRTVRDSRPLLVSVVYTRRATCVPTVSTICLLQQKDPKPRYSGFDWQLSQLAALPVFRFFFSRAGVPSRRVDRCVSRLSTFARSTKSVIQPAGSHPGSVPAALPGPWQPVRPVANQTRRRRHVGNRRLGRGLGAGGSKLQTHMGWNGADKGSRWRFAPPRLDDANYSHFGPLLLLVVERLDDGKICAKSLPEAITVRISVHVRARPYLIPARSK